MSFPYRGYKFWLPSLLALLVSPVIGIFTCISFGSTSHPPYFPKVLFPYSLLLLLGVQDEGLTGWMLVYLPAIQTVTYGIIIGICWSRRTDKPLRWLVVAHILATVLIFAVHPGPGF